LIVAFFVPSLGLNYKERWNQEDQHDLLSEANQLVTSTLTVVSEKLIRSRGSGSGSGTGSGGNSNNVAGYQDSTGSNIGTNVGAGNGGNPGGITAGPSGSGNDDDDGRNRGNRKPPNQHHEDEQDQTPACCGDITKRILSALVEDQLVSPSLLMNSYFSSMGGRSAEGEKGQGSLVGNDTNVASTQQEIDMRLGKELLNLGLIDSQSLAKISQSKEDDEICRSLKLLQEQLRNQVRENKNRRAKYYPVIQKKMEEQENERKQREQLFKQEKKCLKELKQKKEKTNPINPKPEQNTNEKEKKYLNQR